MDGAPLQYRLRALGQSKRVSKTRAKYFTSGACFFVINPEARWLSVM